MEDFLGSSRVVVYTRLSNVDSSRLVRGDVVVRNPHEVISLSVPTGASAAVDSTTGSLISIHLLQGRIKPTVGKLQIRVARRTASDQCPASRESRMAQAQTRWSKCTRATLCSRLILWSTQQLGWSLPSGLRLVIHLYTSLQSLDH